MPTNEDIFKFLTQPENIEIALEVSEFVTQLTDDMHKRFWTDFNRQMELTLHESTYGNMWFLERYPTSKIKDDWKTCNFLPIKHKEYKSDISFVFGQTSRPLYKFFWGVRWFKEKTNIDHPALLKLKQKLIARNIRHVDREPTNWIYWDTSPYSVKDADFLRRMYVDTDVFVSEVVRKVWDLFIEVEPELTTINHEVNKDA